MSALFRVKPARFYPISASFLVCAFLLSHAGMTQAAKAIQVVNQSPVISSFLQAPLPQSSTNPTSKYGSYKAELRVANYISQANIGDEIYFVDGETANFRQSFSLRLENNAVLGLVLPWVHHGSGFLDRYIYDFHDLFGMPQNGRSENREDMFMWEVRHRNRQRISLRHSESGIGDIQLFYEDNFRNYTDWRLSLKLPSGDSELQTGNGGTDLALSTLTMNPEWLKDLSLFNHQQVSIWYGTGAAILGKAEKLEGFRQNRLVFSGLLGLGWNFTPQFSASTQINTHTPYFDSPIRELGWMPILASLSLDITLSSETSLSCMLTEDLRPRVTPDIIFGLDLQHSF